MKKDIHPNLHEITIAFTDGSMFKTRSTWGKPGDTLQLDVDPKTHPAWVGGVHLKKTGQMEKFKNRFAGFDFANASTGGKQDEKKAEGDAAS